MRCSYTRMGNERVRCCRCSTREEAIDFGTETLGCILALPDMKAGGEVRRRGGDVDMLFCGVGDGLEKFM